MVLIMRKMIMTATIMTVATNENARGKMIFMIIITMMWITTNASAMTAPGCWPVGLD